MTRTIRGADFVCEGCGCAFPSWATVIVPVANRAEYLCEKCYAEQQENYPEPKPEAA